MTALSNRQRPCCARPGRTMSSSTRLTKMRVRPVFMTNLPLALAQRTRNVRCIGLPPDALTARQSPLPRHDTLRYRLVGFAAPIAARCLLRKLRRAASRKLGSVGLGFDVRVEIPSVRMGVQQDGSILSLFPMLFKRVVVANVAGVVAAAQSRLLSAVLPLTVCVSTYKNVHALDDSGAAEDATRGLSAVRGTVCCCRNAEKTYQQGAA